MSEKEEVKTRRELLQRLALLERVEDICLEYHVTVDGVLSRKRTKAICAARDACFARMHQLGLSHNEIGQAWGYDHTSVIAAVKRHKDKHRNPKGDSDDVQAARAQQDRVRRRPSQRKAHAVR